MTQPPDSSQQPGEEQDPNKTTVFRPGEGGFGAPPPFGGSDAPLAPPPPPAQPEYPGQPAYGAPPPPPPPAQPYGGQPAYGAPQPGYGQQGYGQPGYQQPAYGQPGYAPQVAQYNQGAAPQHGFGVVGAALTVIGAILGVVSFTAVNWFTGGSSKFNDIHKVFGESGVNRFANDISKLYFNWLGWALLAAAVVTALLAAVPSTSAFRAIGAIVGLAGAAVTFVAVQTFNKHTSELPKQYRSYSDYLSHARLGFYFAVAAFVLTALGAAMGARKRT